MVLNARLVVAAGALALAVSVLHAQQGNPQGGGQGGGRGPGRGGGGQGPGPLIDPSQMPPGPGGRFGGPPRDNQVPTGTAKLTGRVVAAETGNLVRRAQIRLTATDVRANRVATS